MMNSSLASVPLMFFDLPGEAPFNEGCTAMVLQIMLVASSESSIYSPPLMNDSIGLIWMSLSSYLFTWS